MIQVTEEKYAGMLKELAQIRNCPLTRIIQSSVWPSLTLAELRVLICLMINMDEKRMVYKDRLSMLVKSSTMQQTAFLNNLHHLIERGSVRKGFDGDRLMDFWEVLL